MNIIDGVSNALSSALKPEKPNGLTERVFDYLKKGDAEFAERDFATTPKPRFWDRNARKLEKLRREVEEAAAEREKLLALGREYRQKLHAVSQLGAKLTEALEHLVWYHSETEKAWVNAKRLFGDSFHRGASAEWVGLALKQEGIESVLRERFLPELEAELAAAKADAEEFRRQHDFNAVELAEQAAAAV